MRAMLAFLFLAGCAAATPDRPATYDTMVRQFEAVAFGSDFGEGLGLVTKWTDQPRVVFMGDDRALMKTHVPDIEAALFVVQRLTPAKVVFEPDLTKANVAIAFGPRRDFARMIQAIAPGATFRDGMAHSEFTTNSDCMATLFGPPGEIKAAIILIGADIRADRRKRCIVEEIVQSVGLPADACEYAPSVFCETNHAYLPTAADEVLIRTLYDPRLKPGMPKAEAMPIAREIIRDLWKP